ncbi:MAG: ECF-type sigma factor [Acidobacteriota bacterium]
MTDDPSRPLPSPDVTELLVAAGRGDRSASEELLPLVYDELRRHARHLMRGRPAQTLQPTAVVHEAYLRLVRRGTELSWESKGHFFGAAARAIRDVLIEKARERGAKKRGGGDRGAPLEEDMAVETRDGALDVLLVNELLEELKRYDVRKHDVVELRIFAGLTVDETASALGVAPKTVKRDWTYAKSWLSRRLAQGGATVGG